MMYYIMAHKKKIIIGLIVIIALAVGAYFGIEHYTNSKIELPEGVHFNEDANQQYWELYLSYEESLTGALGMTIEDYCKELGYTRKEFAILTLTNILTEQGVENPEELAKSAVGAQIEE